MRPPYIQACMHTCMKFSGLTDQGLKGPLQAATARWWHPPTRGTALARLVGCSVPAKRQALLLSVCLRV